jgi:hypothetical protein
MGARDFGLGRLQAPFDGRDTLYRMRAAAPQIVDALGAPKPRKAPYKEPVEPLNQGNKPHCVAFSGKGFMLAAPTMRDPGYDTTDVYRECQKIDEWPGEAYDGTSVRALMKILTAREWITSYVWGQTSAEAIAWMNGGFGTIIIGTNWYAEMDEVDDDGFIREPGPLSTPVGGHAYRVNWLDMKIPIKKANRVGYLVPNSWGRLWGMRKRDGTRTGRAYMRPELFDRLMREQGEIAAPVQALKIKPVIL